jgi:pimeloyl-ACP methyl ester carboxylesterase
MGATVVLVHGASSGAWSWWKVTPLLEERGISYRAVDLPTSGAADTSIGILDDVAHVEAVIDEIDGPVVLVGNSYGGVVISGVDRPRVVRLVYLAAQMPAAREPIMGMLAECATPELSAASTLLDDGRLAIDLESVIREAYRQADPADHDVVRANFPGVMSMGSDFTVAFDRVSWERVPSTYVVCSDDRATQPSFERLWAKEQATDWVEWPADHCPQTSHPELVADLIEELLSA